MPTKRPDQLPEGEDFDFEDILMVEKSPNSDARNLQKTQLRNFMESALKMDPERMGANAILGMQSKFDWLIAQMETLSNTETAGIQKYSDFSSESKNQEFPFITPSPSPTPSITPTPSKTPIPPAVTPSPTPTPSSTPPPSFLDLQITFLGPKSNIIALPDQFLPEQNNFNTWQLIDGGYNSNLHDNFQGYKPVSFTPSTLNEKLFAITADIENRTLNITVMKYKEVTLFGGSTVLVEDETSPLINGSNVTIKIRLL